jgi:hypothetical protein
MKTNHVPELFFKKDQHPLALSEKCISLKEVKINIWVFELINLYQTLDYIATQSYQRWCFHKQEKEILITCYNVHERLTHSMMADIGHHHSVFSDINICVFEGKCMAEEECEVAMKRNSA